MEYLVYQIVNNANGKIYIGAHEGTPDDDYFGSGVAIKNAIHKWGKESFTKSILHVCVSADEMFAKEAELVTEEFVARKDTYNIKVGGAGFKKSDFQTAVWEPKRRQRLSEAQKRNWRNPEYAQRQRNVLQSTELRRGNAERMVERNKRQWEDPTFREKMQSLDRTHTDEHKQKVSDSLKRAYATGKRNKSTKVSESMRAIGQKNKGARWMKRGNESVLAQPEQLHVLQQDGWVPGRPKFKVD